MINIFVHEISTRQVQRLQQTAKGRLKNIRLVTYQSAFRQLSLPAGTLIFTDFDYLNVIEMQAAANMAQAARQAEAATPVLNDPLAACERYQLMKRLHARAISPVIVNRLDDEEMPPRFPVFIRAEDGWWGPDTDILEDETAYSAALARLKSSGKPIKRRIAVSFEGETDSDGYYRKYGAFRIGDRIIPQHILRNRHWMVKSDGSTFDEAFAREEFEYVRDNPHQDQLMAAFEAGNIEFGRIDYSFKQGQLIVFEINTNPSFPRFSRGKPGREDRRKIILDRLVEAFEAVQPDRPNSKSRIKFEPPELGRRWMQASRWGLMTRAAWRLRLALRKYHKHAGTKPGEDVQATDD